MVFLAVVHTMTEQATEPLSAASQLGLGGGLAGLCLIAVKVLFSAQAKTLELERERVAELTEALRRRNEQVDDRVADLTETLRKRNESIEERVLPALIASAEATKHALKAARREHRDAD